MNELGVEHFSIHLIEEWPDDDTLLTREQHWIEYFSSGYPFGYNADAKSLKKHRQREGITWEQQRVMLM